MPVAPAAVSSVWAGRGGHWFAVAVGGGSLTAAIVSTSITGKENIDRFKLDKQGFCKLVTSSSSSVGCPFED